MRFQAWKAFFLTLWSVLDYSLTNLRVVACFAAIPCELPPWLRRLLAAGVPCRGEPSAETPGWRNPGRGRVVPGGDGDPQAWPRNHSHVLRRSDLHDPNRRVHASCNRERLDVECVKH